MQFLSRVKCNTNAMEGVTPHGQSVRRFRSSAYLAQLFACHAPQAALERCLMALNVAAQGLVDETLVAPAPTWFTRSRNQEETYRVLFQPLCFLGLKAAIKDDFAPLRATLSRWFRGLGRSDPGRGVASAGTVARHQPECQPGFVGIRTCFTPPDSGFRGLRCYTFQ